MTYSLAEIAAALGAEAAGDLSLSVARACEPASAGPDDLAVALSPAFAGDLGQARAALLWPGADWQALGLQAAIFAPRARMALSRLTQAMAPDDGFWPGRHPTAVCHETAEVPEDAWLGPFAVVGPGVRLGQGARLGPHVSIGANTVIGAEARLHAGVRIGARVRIGDRFTAQPGAVIGGDGFSFVTGTPSGPEQAKAHQGREPIVPPERPEWHKIESLGAVEIGDDVEIGANACVDAGTLRATRIGDGCKLDNLVQIGHNVILGRHCALSAQCGVAGSTVLGDRVVLGGQTGVADHLTIGSDVVAGGASVILSSIPPGRVVLGYPAQRMDRELAQVRQLRRLRRRTGRTD